MQVETFTMERWQSTWEHHVEINLSDSGVFPLTLEELLEGEDCAQLLSQRLIYTQSNGTPELRDHIAALYPGATRDNLEVTNGGAEANLLTAWTLIKPGDEVILQLPNYMQLWGVLRAVGANVKPWHLQPDLDNDCWSPAIDQLEELVTPQTKMIALCNPNNPTGATLNSDELDQIAAIASRHGAWTLVDEIYQGAELDGTTTPTMWGRHERVVVTNSLSKAYGLPGLRIGWILSSPETVEACWSRHDYTTIAPGALNDLLAQRALEPERRNRILQRTRKLLTENLAIALKWVDSHDQLRTIKPRAGAFLMLAYENGIKSLDLAERLRVEKSVLLVPGDHFGMDGWLRVGFGEDTDMLNRGLDRLDEFLHTLVPA